MALRQGNYERQRFVFLVQIRVAPPIALIGGKEQAIRRIACLRYLQTFFGRESENEKNSYFAHRWYDRNVRR